MMVVSSTKIPTHISHQFAHPGAGMVTRDVGVQIFPRPFDLVVVRTVGREEVESDPSPRVAG
jgi:hypothetical protein